MKPEEIRDLGSLAGDAIGGTASRIYDMHEGIAGRVFGALGPLATPVQPIHDRLARRTYAGVSGALARATRAGAGALARTRDGDAPSITDSRAGRVAVGALNGMYGDLLSERGNGLALPMTLRCRGRDVAITQAELGRAFPDATPRLAVFLHGLCETDDSWRIGAERHVPYGTRLRAELGYTPLYVRYNTGLHISANGRELARLLDELTAAWPVEVAEIAMIGHSMGALVSRSACHYGAQSEWVTLVRDVFMLGAPHRGAPLEQAANATTAAFRRLPETRGVARAIDLRSAGVKDLGRGYLLDEDWEQDDPDQLLRKIGREVPFLQSANNYFISATVSRDPDAPAGRIVGDLLVLRASAWAHGGHGERMHFPVSNYKHIGGITHFDLLNHPAVYEQIQGWLSSAKALPAEV